MTKLTPPAPQHKKRRIAFFLAHPEHPGAKETFDRVNADIIEEAQRDHANPKNWVGFGKDRKAKRTLEQIAEEIWYRVYPREQKGEK